MLAYTAGGFIQNEERERERERERWILARSTLPYPTYAIHQLSVSASHLIVCLLFSFNVQVMFWSCFLLQSPGFLLLFLLHIHHPSPEYYHLIFPGPWFTQYSIAITIATGISHSHLDTESISFCCCTHCSLSSIRSSTLILSCLVCVHPSFISISISVIYHVLPLCEVPVCDLSVCLSVCLFFSSFIFIQHMESLKFKDAFFIAIT